MSKVKSNEPQVFPCRGKAEAGQSACMQRGTPGASLGDQRAGDRLTRKGCRKRYSEGVVHREARVLGLIITVAQIRPCQLEAELA